MRRIYTIIFRMLFFLSSIFALAFWLRERLLDAFLSNVGINVVILAVFLFGVLITFIRVINLRPEFAWILRFNNSYGRGDVKLLRLGRPRLLGPTATMLHDKISSSGRLVLSGSMMRSLLDGVGLRLEENRALNRYIVGVLVFLGLLGTFWGLMDTVSGVSLAIDALGGNIGGEIAIDRLKQSLEKPLDGMATAFSSSLFGLSGSLIVGFFAMQSDQAQNRFYNYVEEWLSTLTNLGSGMDGGEVGISGYTEALLEQMADHLDRLQRVVGKENEQQRQVSDGLLELGHKLGNITDFMVAEQKILQKLVETLSNMGGQNSVNGEILVQSRRLEKQISQLNSNILEGREHLTEDIRREIRLLARTISSVYSGNAVSTKVRTSRTSEE